MTPLWTPDQESLDHSTEIMETLVNIPTTTFAEWLSKNIGSYLELTSQHVSVFSDALNDFSQFVEEIRFEIGLADIYLMTVAEEVFSLFPVNQENNIHLPREAKAILTPYLADIPNPSALFSNPREHITRKRILGGWFAGQLLDSALIRSISALDRIAIMLWCVAGRDFPLNQRNQGNIYPAFRPDKIDKLNSAFSALEGWATLKDLANDPLLKFILPHRNGFIHSRRQPMMLHGDDSASTDLGGGRPSANSFDIAGHMELAFAVYLKILTPAAQVAQEIVQLFLGGTSQPKNSSLP